MTYPKGETVHYNLSTEYTDVPELLSILKSNGFAGIVEVEAAQKKGVFFVGSGRIINAQVEAEGNPLAQVGDEAVDDLLALSTQPDAVLNVYRVALKEVEFAASRLRSEPLFKGLTTDFVRLDRFIKKLESDGHNGYIEIFTRKNEPMGILVLKNGELSDLHIASDSGQSSFSQQEAIPTFLDSVIGQGAIFDVYRSLLNGVPKETTIGEEKQPERPEPPGATVAQDLGPLVDGRGTDGMPQNGRTDSMLALQEVLAKVEKFVGGFSQKGGFQRALKRAFIEKSDTYPFLDPFAGQFDYNDGRIAIDDEVGTEEFAVGIADCLSLTFSYLKKEFPRNVLLPPALKKEIETTFEYYQDAIKRSGIVLTLPATSR